MDYESDDFCHTLTSEPYPLDVTERQDDSGWLRWCPTSMALLRAAEKRILSYLKSPFRAEYVNVGPIVGQEENKIWTVKLNEGSSQLPLVLLHGFGAGVGLWCLNLDSLARSRPVYAIDLLGFGRSSRPQFSSTPLEAESEFVESVEAWRKKVGLERFVLLGHSMGGFLASSYALQYPDRVAHVILADPWGFPEKPNDAYTRSRLPLWVKGVAYILQPLNPLWIVRASGPLGPRLVSRARPDIVRKFAGAIDDANSVIPNYIYHCNAQYPSGEAAFHAMMESFGWAKNPMIKRITGLAEHVPLTFIYGARSWIDQKPGHHLMETRGSHSSVTVRIIDGAGHHVYADNYSEFNSMVLDACSTIVKT